MSTDGKPHIVAIGGGGFMPNDRYGLTPSPLLRYALDLTGQDRPRVCHLATALGDAADAIARFYAALAGTDAEVSHLALFPMPNHEDPAAHLLAQDLVYVSGGSVANLLALWRLHGLADAFAEAWRTGVVLCGQSAGALCWHVGGTTDSFGPHLRPLTDGLGLLPYSCGVHYDSDRQRRPLLQRLVAEGELPDGYAADEAVALHYVGTEFVQAVSYVEGQGAYQVAADGSGGVKETRIEPRLLASF
ncbi:Type 1 glutamine amidotransferase-like domain-containing protein [Actinoallomurus soli]|uniref:Type 1 glutamine amidotransferase-like domain-containing protein n=1 Tax=Actinoallomurus soli TaxID=2952535 RepID=UPI0020926E56|nr:peptidase E [Actinoallomurus soli]MCO5967051.1 peptidase E [Actinoallomurus soli]